MAFLFKEDWYFLFKIYKNYVKKSKKNKKRGWDICIKTTVHMSIRKTGIAL